MIHLASRRVHILGSTPHPDEAFMRQVGWTLTMADAETCRVLICDRDTKWTGSVRECLRAARIRTVQTPYQAPNANAYAERFVRSIKKNASTRSFPWASVIFGALYVSRRALPPRTESSRTWKYADRRRTRALDGFSSSPIASGRILNYYDRAA